MESSSLEHQKLPIPLLPEQKHASIVSAPDQQQKLNSDMSSELNNTESPIDHQEHHEEPSTGEDVMEVSPSLRDHDKNFIVKESHPNDFVNGMDLPKHCHPSSEEHGNEISLNGKSTANPTENDYSKLAGVGEAEERDPHSVVIDTSREQHVPLIPIAESYGVSESPGNHPLQLHPPSQGDPNAPSLMLVNDTQKDIGTSLKEDIMKASAESNTPIPLDSKEGCQQETFLKESMQRFSEKHHAYTINPASCTDEAASGSHYEGEILSQSSFMKGPPQESHQNYSVAREDHLLSVSPKQGADTQAHHQKNPDHFQLEAELTLRQETDPTKENQSLDTQDQMPVILQEQQSNNIPKHSKEASLETVGEKHVFQPEKDQAEAIKQEGGKDFDAPSVLSEHETEIQVQVRSAEEFPLSSSSAEAHTTVAEQLTVKGHQNVTLQSSQKSARAVIDTAAPFESVKAAVSLFGERMDWKSQTRPSHSSAPNVERRILPDSELQKVQDELMHSKDQLALAQASTAGILLELRKVKGLIKDTVSKPEGADALSHKHSESANTSGIVGGILANKHNDHELMPLMQELENLKGQLSSVSASKEAAAKGLQDALTSMNLALKRVNVLSGEKQSLEEAVADAQLALADAEEHVALLRSGTEAKKAVSMSNDAMEKKSAQIKELEARLEETTRTIATLKEDLMTSKKAEGAAMVAASATQQKIEQVKLELEQAKSGELSFVGKLASVLEESEELKSKLEKTVHDSANLSATVDALKLDIDQSQKELESMHQKEHEACSTLAALQEELHKLKEALRSAQESETRALEAKDTLPLAIKQAASEADQAKVAAQAAKKASWKARKEIDQARAATSTANSRQQAASKELEAVKASEAMALAELKALEESESHSGDTEAISDGAGVTISLEEYSALKQAAVEAEGLADKKVVQVVLQVEEAKASQEKAQAKLEEATREAEKCRQELDKAQKYADEAQEAKLTAEADLRKWRAEHDQRRRSANIPDPKKIPSNNHPVRMSDVEKSAKPIPHEKDDLFPAMMQTKKASGRDSLAQIMSLDVSAPEGVQRMKATENPTKEEVKVKKKNLIRKITSIVALKKHQS
ncbi:hypothetical protein KP509_15G069000 [Ceratopteris richardii]|uniref:Uncharacterized protein n=2 Tax=Ceratopteris richardii TaxID=49495 RepID=A0A8T2T896_CERRI|nr:hypothetical protein KP509_15G069000 [Ceratopteris richardii]